MAVEMNSSNAKFGKIMITASNFQNSCSIIVEKPVERVDFYHVSYKNYPRFFTCLLTNAALWNIFDIIVVFWISARNRETQIVEDKDYSNIDARDFCKSILDEIVFYIRPLDNIIIWEFVHISFFDK